MLEKNSQRFVNATTGDLKHTPLIVCVRNGANMDILKLLLKYDADVDKADKDGWTALRWAAAKGHVEAIAELVKAGADVNKAGSAGSTALHWAAVYGHVEAIAELIKAGADVNKVTNYGFTALHWAAEKGHDAAVAELIKAGVEIDKADKRGWTALHWAAWNGHVEAIAELSKAGADPTIPNKSNRTAVDLAADKSPEIRALFLPWIHPELSLKSYPKDALAKIDIATLSLSPKLIKLDLSSCRLSQLPSLKNLINLKDLDLSNNQLTSLPDDLIELKSLQSLDISNNQLTLFPRGLSFVDQVVLNNNPWNAITGSDNRPIPTPPTVFDSPWPDLKLYISKLTDKAVPLHKLRLLMVGEGASGKTWLANYLQTGKPRQNDVEHAFSSAAEGLLKKRYDETFGILEWRWQTSGTKIDVLLLDCAGQPEYHPSHQLFMDDQTVYVVLVSLEYDIATIEQQVQQWIQVISTRTPKLQCLFVCSKVDKATKQHIESAVKAIEAIGVAHNAEMIGNRVHCVSGKTGQGVDDLRTVINSAVEQLSVEYKIPGWYDALGKAIPAIKNIHQTFPVFSSSQQLGKALKEQGWSDEDISQLDQALPILARLGEIALIGKYIVLHPPWVFDRLAEACRMTSKQKLVDVKTGTVLVEHLRQCWRNEKISEDHISDLIELLCQAQLASRASPKLNVASSRAKAEVIEHKDGSADQRLFLPSMLDQQPAAAASDLLHDINCVRFGFVQLSLIPIGMWHRLLVCLYQHKSLRVYQPWQSGTMIIANNQLFVLQRSHANINQLELYGEKSNDLDSIPVVFQMIQSAIDMCIQEYRYGVYVQFEEFSHRTLSNQQVDEAEQDKDVLEQVGRSISHGALRIPYSQLHLDPKPLGKQGMFGLVYKGRYLNNIVCVKGIKRQPENNAAAPSSVSPEEQQVISTPGYEMIGELKRGGSQTDISQRQFAQSTTAYDVSPGHDHTEEQQMIAPPGYEMIGELKRGNSQTDISQPQFVLPTSVDNDLPEQQVIPAPGYEMIGELKRGNSQTDIEQPQFVQSTTVDDDVREQQAIPAPGYELIPELKRGNYQSISEEQRFVQQQQFKSLLNEIGKMAMVKHVNVVSFFGYTIKDGELYAVTGFCGKGDLSAYLSKSKTAIEQSNLLKWITQISFGLEALHQHGVMHRDLWLDNVFLDDQLNAKVADFGLASQMFNSNNQRFDRVALAETQLIPAEWSAPELNAQLSNYHVEITPEQDIYSFGVVIIEMFTNYIKLFAGHQQSTPAERGHIFSEHLVNSGKSLQQQAKQLESMVDCPDPVLQLCHRCLSVQPADRPAIATITEQLKQFYQEQQQDTNNNYNNNGPASKQVDRDKRQVVAWVWDPKPEEFGRASLNLIADFRCVLLKNLEQLKQLIADHAGQFNGINFKVVTNRHEKAVVEYLQTVFPIPVAVMIVTSANNKADTTKQFAHYRRVVVTSDIMDTSRWGTLYDPVVVYEGWLDILKTEEKLYFKPTMGRRFVLYAHGELKYFTKDNKLHGTIDLTKVTKRTVAKPGLNQHAFELDVPGSRQYVLIAKTSDEQHQWQLHIDYCIRCLHSPSKQ